MRLHTQIYLRFFARDAPYYDYYIVMSYLSLRFRFIGMILRHKGKVSEPEVVGKDWGKKLGLQDAARGFVK